MYHISKSIYLRQIKLTDSCSASQNQSEKHINIFQCETGVQVCKFIPISKPFLEAKLEEMRAAEQTKNLIVSWNNYE